MIIKLGESIRALRKRDGRTQEDLAAALGVSGQAVSRWEMGQGYPDMEFIPSIANYFGVRIDELFGYRSDREERVNAYIEQHDAFEREEGNLEERLDHIRRGVAEFPAEESLLIRLAETLVLIGSEKYGFQAYTTSDSDYILKNGGYGAKNEYWQEALTVFRRILAETECPKIKERALVGAIDIMGCMGMYEEAVDLANEQPSLIASREILKSNASDGKECYRYTGEAIIALANALYDAVIGNLSMRMSLYDSPVKAEKYYGLIRLYEMIFDDGNFGFHHWRMRDLYLSLASEFAGAGSMDDAFDCIRKAKEYTAAYDKTAAAGKCTYTAVLLDKVTEGSGIGVESDLAAAVPNAWQLTLDQDVYASLKADPRWSELFPEA